MNEPDTQSTKPVSDATTDTPHTSDTAPTTPTETTPESGGSSTPQTSASEPAASESTNTNSGHKSILGYILAGVVVAVVILGALFLLEKEGRSSTNFFGAIIEEQANGAAVAVVNGTEITVSELTESKAQFTEMATAQGVDTQSTEAQAEIESQSLQVLINTELLRQEATAREIVADEAAVAERIAQIEEQLGGEAALNERITTLGLTTEELQNDIQEEIIIERLLEEVFAEAEITVTEDEIAAVYANAGDAEDLPPLADVQAQVEQQILNSKEQQAVDAFLNELRTEAEIEIML